MSPQPIMFNPGIVGFEKAHRYPNGSALVMSHDQCYQEDTVSVYWVSRLHYHAKPVGRNVFPVANPIHRHIAECVYDAMLLMGPPAHVPPDRQRHRVYQWEADNIFPGFEPLTWRGCQRFLNRVWRSISKDEPPILTSRRRFLDAISLNGMIHLPRNNLYFWRKPVILHEITHELVPGGHSKQFVSVYINLCVRFLRIRRDLLTTSADRYGVEY